MTAINYQSHKALFVVFLSKKLVSKHNHMIVHNDFARRFLFLGFYYIIRISLARIYHEARLQVIPDPPLVNEYTLIEHKDGL